MEEATGLKLLNLLFAAGPEGLAMFILLDVRQVNLTGKHLIGQGSTK
jgi:hypothetical protein